MSTVISKNVQVGNSGTAAQNFTWYQPASPDGTVRLGVGNSGVTTGDVITANSSGVTVTGTLAATSISGSGASLTALDASTLTTGTVPDARFPATLPAVSGANLTNLNAGNLSTGTINRARLPAGSLLQVQFNDFGTLGYTAVSGSNVDYTGFSASFTPLYSSSKVLIILSAGVNYVCDGVTYLKRNGSIVKNNWFGSSRTDDTNDYPQATALYLDSPATTSAITYQIGGRASGCGQNIRFGSSGEGSTTMTFMEIAA
jgi:hypothetical protein